MDDVTIVDVRVAEIAARAEAATPIADFPGYSVDRAGNVWSDSNWRGYGRRQITPVVGAGGYLKVRLKSSGGKRVNRTVHRLVAEAFLGERHGQIRHLNGDQTDNRCSNLAWGTAKENADDREAHGTTARGEKNGYS